MCQVNDYDGLGRLLQTYKQHNQGGGATLNAANYDVAANTYDFTNAILTKNRKHYNAAISTSAPAVTIANTYTYDHMERKKQVQESINGGTNVIVSQLDYNEIGQVLNKHLHSTSYGSSFLQNVVYTYNERSWLLSENAPLFSEQLQYNTGTNKQYNGNIAYQLYQSAATPATTTYAYTYDQLNRLTSGTSSDNYNETGIRYDLNGNIQTLQRTYGSATVVDNLAYSYGGTTQVQSISDASADMTAGKFYPKGSFAYTYDPNGNIWTDASKGITTNISYNLLNLPNAVTANSKTATFTYDAAGRKLRKVSAISGVNTDYIDGIQYEAGAISFIQTEEGRALNSSGSYHYEYSLTDHLGNSRLTFDTYSGAAITVQQDDYLPFGYEISRGNITSPKNEYLYNKKELQEDLVLEDYGARFYDPVIGRMTSIDPHASSYVSWSGYSYVADNPISGIDPDGRDLIVLSAPNHVPSPAGDLGHAAVLIGNEKTGYNYYSKNGTHENHGAFGSSDKNPVVGRHYNSLKEFEESDDNKKDGPYSKALDIKTDEATDKKMEAAAKASVTADYNVLAKSCIDVASDAARAGKLDPGYSGNSFFGIQNHYLTPIPNVRFNNMIKNNPGSTIIILPLPEPKKEKVGTVTVDPAEVTQKVIPNNQNPN